MAHIAAAPGGKPSAKRPIDGDNKDSLGGRPYIWCPTTGISKHSPGQLKRMSLQSHEHIDELARHYGNDFAPDVERGLSRLHQSIDQRGDRRGAKVRSLPVRRWLAVAASIALLITAGFFFLSSDGIIITNNDDAPMAVELPDGSSVILQSGSTLSYDGAYAGAERRVELAGQGYFEIVPNADKPFLVTYEETTLRVTGTAFNLRVKENNLEVEVSEGSIELEYHDNLLPVAANQCGIAKSGHAPVRMPAPNLNRHAWRTGHLVFENTPVREALDVLHNNWDVTVADLPPDCDYPVSFTYAAESSADIDAILSNIAKLGSGSLQPLGDNQYELVKVCQ